MFLIRRKSFQLLSGLVILSFSQHIYAAENFTSYLFAYFTGNDNTKSQEALRFAISDDAHTFKALNKNNPVLSSAKISSTGGIRDPHILRGENNDYYMVATDMVSKNGWNSNHGIVMMKSTNLTDWKTSTVDIRTAFTAYKNTDRVWAPQTIYDPVNKKYMVYFAMRTSSTAVDKIYYAYADSSFTKLETVPAVLFTNNNLATIDADIIYKDSTYHLFFKTEGNGNGIKSALSKKLTEGYQLFDKYLQITTQAVEGSCVFKLINSDTYILMYDVYNSGRYEFAQSTDLKTFTLDTKAISFDFTPRHGTVIPITTAEKNALLAKWDPTDVKCKSRINDKALSLSIRGNSLYLSLASRHQKLTVSLINISGQTVLRRTISGQSAVIDLSNVASGSYRVCCRNGAGVSEYEEIIIR